MKLCCGDGSHSCLAPGQPWAAWLSGPSADVYDKQCQQLVACDLLLGCLLGSLTHSLSQVSRLPQGDHVTPDAGLVTPPYGQKGKKADHAPPICPVHVLAAASAPPEAWEESRWEPTFTERLMPPHTVFTHLACLDTGVGAPLTGKLKLGERSAPCNSLQSQSRRGVCRMEPEEGTNGAKSRIV